MKSFTAIFTVLGIKLVLAMSQVSIGNIEGQCFAESGLFCKAILKVSMEARFLQNKLARPWLYSTLYMIYRIGPIPIRFVEKDFFMYFLLFK